MAELEEVVVPLWCSVLVVNDVVKLAVQRTHTSREVVEIFLILGGGSQVWKLVAWDQARRDYTWRTWSVATGPMKQSIFTSHRLEPYNLWLPVVTAPAFSPQPIKFTLPKHRSSCLNHAFPWQNSRFCTAHSVRSMTDSPSTLGPIALHCHIFF